MRLDLLKERIVTDKKDGNIQIDQIQRKRCPQTPPSLSAKKIDSCRNYLKHSPLAQLAKMIQQSKREAEMAATKEYALPSPRKSPRK